MSQPITTTPADAVNALYLAYYGRPADPAGLHFWTKQLEHAGGDLAAITTAFAGSEEAQARFAGVTPAERIADIYQQLFGRAPETAGLTYWTDVVENGDASMADVSLAILQGVQESDKGVAALHLRAAERFTAQVEASGSAYAGDAAIEAARVLLRAVTAETGNGDIDGLVASTVVFADVASKKPDVVKALAGNGSLLDLFDTAHGKAEPVALVQALANTAKVASGNPAALATLLHNGGMAQVLKKMPAGTSLHEVADAVAHSGLSALDDLVNPVVATPHPNPSPTPTPAHAPTPEPQASELTSIDYYFIGTPSMIGLYAGPDKIVTVTGAGSAHGLHNADSLVLSDFGTGAALPTAEDYLKGGAFFGLSGMYLSFAHVPAAGLYQLSWSDDTFATSKGYVKAGQALFAGGIDSGFWQEGFDIDAIRKLDGTSVADDERVNRAYIDDGLSASQISTGSGHDVVLDHGGTLTIAYSTFNGDASDLIVGFDKRHDTIALDGELAHAVDADGNGTIEWLADSAAGVATATTESVHVTIDKTVTSSASSNGDMVAVLNDVLDLTNVKVDGSLLLLVNSTLGDTGAALFSYRDIDGNKIIDAADLTLIAMFAGGSPVASDIVIVGSPAPEAASPAA